MSRDFKLVENDLYIDPNTGDFVITDSDLQHAQSIISSFVGHWKEYPTVGVGIQLYANATGKEDELLKEIRTQLEADGFRLNSVDAVQIGIDHETNKMTVLIADDVSRN